MELLTETDFEELPNEPHHKWLVLQKLAKARLNEKLAISPDDTEYSALSHYMTIVAELASSFGVKGVAGSQEPNIYSVFDKFELSVQRARIRILAESPPTFPFGRVQIPSGTKEAILALTATIELQIGRLNESDKRKLALYAKLEDFRREINQPKSRIATALSQIAQIAAVVLATEAVEAVTDAAIANIVRLLGAEHSEATGSDLLLLDSEKTFLIEGQQIKMIEGPKSKDA